MFYSILRIFAWALRIAWIKSLENARMGILECTLDYSVSYACAHKAAVGCKNLYLEASSWWLKEAVLEHKDCPIRYSSKTYGNDIGCGGVRYVYALSVSAYVRYKRGCNHQEFSPPRTRQWQRYFRGWHTFFPLQVRISIFIRNGLMY